MTIREIKKSPTTDVSSKDDSSPAEQQVDNRTEREKYEDEWIEQNINYEDYDEVIDIGE